MRKFIVSLIVFNFAIFQLAAQCDPVVDSFLSGIEDNIPQIDTLNELAWKYRDTDLELAFKFANCATIRSQKVGYLQGLGDSYMRQGLVVSKMNKLEAADSLYHLAIKIRTKLGIPINVARVYNNLGLLYAKAGIPESAVIFFENGLAELNKAGSLDKTGEGVKARIQNNLGDAYKKVGFYERALDSFKQSLAIREKHKDTLRQAFTHLNMSSLYYEPTFRFKDPDKSKFHLESALEIFELKKKEAAKAKCYLNLGNLMLYKNELDSAHIFYRKALDSKQLSTVDSLKVEKNIGSIYFKKKNYKKALGIFSSCLTDLENLKVYDEHAMLCSDIGNVYFELGDYPKALTHLKKSLIIADSFNLYNLRTFSLTSINKAHEWELKLEKERRTTLTIIGLLGLLVILATAASLIYRKQKKQQLAEKNMLLAKQEVDVLVNEQVLKTTWARLDGIEQERKRIAAELHDRIGVMLSTAKLYFAPMDEQVKGLKDQDREKYRKANQILDETYGEIRRISHDMASPSLTTLGLVRELELLANRIEEAKQLTVKVSAHNMQERLDSNIEIRLYRIIQEVITNSLKHAKASEINIELNHFDDLLNVMIEDNGIGFNSAHKDIRKKGLGLNNIKSRIEDLNGSLDIDSVIGRGTTITIDIPLEAI